MEYVYIGIALFAVLAVVGLLVYLVVAHKISTTAITSHLGILHTALAPAATVSVAAAPAAGTSALPEPLKVEVAPAPAVAPPAPAPAPAPAADGSDPAKVTTLIAQLQAKGVTSWPQIVVYLQTWGFSRGLTPSEWHAALAAGMPAAMLQPPTVPTDTSAPFWRPLGDGGFEAAFDHVSGAWCHVKGPGYLHIMVPAGFVGRIWPCANLCPDTAYPVKTTVNHGDLKESVTDGEQAHGMLVFGDTPGANEIAGTPGQWIEMEFDQAATSGYVGVFYIYPKTA